MVAMVARSKIFLVSGEKLAEARIRAGLSQQMLAERIGRSVSSIAKAEGKPIAAMFLSVRGKLADALKITEERLRAELEVEPSNAISESDSIGKPLTSRKSGARVLAMLREAVAAGALTLGQVKDEVASMSGPARRKADKKRRRQ